MQWLNDRCQQQLDAADQANLRRTLKPVDMSDGRTMNRNSTSYLQFASNDYLGLAAEPVDLGVLQLSLPGSGASPSLWPPSSLPGDRTILPLPRR